MTEDAPTFPDGLSDAVRDELDASSPAELRQIARYADALADRRDPDGGTAVDEDGDGDGDGDSDDSPGGQPGDQPGDQSAGRTDDQSDDRPAEVPSKATVTIKEINDNRYYYWQWRDGDEIKSKYKGPVSPDE